MANQSINKQLGIGIAPILPSRYVRGLKTAQAQLGTEDWSLDFYNDLPSYSNTSGSLSWRDSGGNQLTTENMKHFYDKQTTVDTFLNAASDEKEQALKDAIATAKASVATVQTTIQGKMSAKASWDGTRRSWLPLTYDDWKDRNKKDEGWFINNCSASQCYHQGKTGRGDRYDRRYGNYLEAIAKMAEYQRQADVLTDTTLADARHAVHIAENALSTYQQALNEKIAAGHNVETATELAHLQIQEQEQDMQQQQQIVDSQLQQIQEAPKDTLVKIAVIGIIAIIGVVVMLKAGK